ncbi:histidine phosphatase family protein [Nocardioides dongxiaopingii]|uniref:histidine phosphatase family protein n=1 Tax=Nocardioides dongxiaopingii TaxID=2576036 RepID=UPI001485794A|nr:histidine phosphatase family protein [Nocardioides dongxiaopingii]
MRLHLVRHGRPAVERHRPAHEWVLDPAGYDDVWALRDRLPRQAAWYCSPEPRATETAQLLTDAGVGIVDGLREHVRDSTEWVEDLEDAVRDAFARPEVSVRAGWEPLAHCRARVVAAVEPILATHADEGVVLVGHGTAWTALAAVLGGTEPDLDRWARLTLPDVLVLDLA